MGPTGPFFPSCLPGTLLNTATYAQALSHVASLKGEFGLCCLLGRVWALPACATSKGMAEIVRLSCFLGPAHLCTCSWCSSISPSVRHSQGQEQYPFLHTLSCLMSTRPEKVGEHPRYHGTTRGPPERRLFQKCHSRNSLRGLWLKEPD